MAGLPCPVALLGAAAAIADDKARRGIGPALSRRPPRPADRSQWRVWISMSSSMPFQGEPSASRQLKQRLARSLAAARHRRRRRTRPRLLGLESAAETGLLAAAEGRTRTELVRPGYGLAMSALSSSQRPDRCRGIGPRQAASLNPDTTAATSAPLWASLLFRSLGMPLSRT